MLEPIKWNFPTEPSIKKNNETYKTITTNKTSNLPILYVPKETPIIENKVENNFIQFVDYKTITMEVIPSKITSNDNNRYLFVDIARLHKKFLDSIEFSWKEKKVKIKRSMGVWWEILLTKKEIRFFATIPDVDFIREGLTNRIRTVWSQSTTKQVQNPIPEFPAKDTSITKLRLKYHSVLSLDTSNHQFNPLETLLNVKHYIRDDEYAIVQIGMFPYGEGWQYYAKETLDKIKKTNLAPAKDNPTITVGKIMKYGLWGFGVVLEEAVNFICDMFLPGYQESKDVYNSIKVEIPTIQPCTHQKARKEAFYTSIRIAVKGREREGREMILRAISSSFDQMNGSGGNNEWIEEQIPDKMKEKEIEKMLNRDPSDAKDVLGSHELSMMITLPDRRVQMLHMEELKTASHRSEVGIPSVILKETGVPFGKYEDQNGEWKEIYLPNHKLDSFCLPDVVIGSPGSGKTTFGINWALENFKLGHGVLFIDAADGQAIQRIVNHVPEDKKNKVIILDFKNSKYPISLNFVEAYHPDLNFPEATVTEEIIQFIESNSQKELSMTSRRWVELASKTIFKNKDSCLGDILKILQNQEYCEEFLKKYGNIHLQKQWHGWWNMSQAQRDRIISSSLSRLYKILHNDRVKHCFLQPPKYDEQGRPLLDFRRLMDEGYMVLAKVNETLQEEAVNAICSFLIAKMNLAIISRENMTERGENPNPCVIIMDEPDHYIRSSEKWRNMGTRYRKYRASVMYLFHGWKQLIETDRHLPELIRQSNPNYFIFKTDEENLKTLRFIYEPEFHFEDVVKGIPHHHAIVRLQTYLEDGTPTPAFMVKTLDPPEKRFTTYNHTHWYEDCAKRFGRHIEEVEKCALEYEDMNPVEEIDDEEDDSRRETHYTRMGVGKFKNSYRTRYNDTETD